MPKIVFKNRIADYMTDHHKSDKDILEAVPISRNTLYRLKAHGETSRLDANTVKAFTDFFGIPLDRLFYIGESDRQD